MKAIIPNTDCQCIEVIQIPKWVEEEIGRGEMSVEQYLVDNLWYTSGIRFMVVDKDCPIYDVSEDSDSIEEPIYVIK